MYDVTKLDSSVISEMKKDIMDKLPLISKLDKLIVFNIGTERIDFDSFGPILGTVLEKKIKQPRFQILSMFLDIVGTSNDPCHGLSLPLKYEELDSKYKDMNTFIIATDAAIVSKYNNLHKIKIESRSIKPGAGMGKSFRSIGDVSICMTTLVGENGKSAFLSKHSVSKKKIMNVCEVMSDIILEAVRDKMLEEF